VERWHHDLWHQIIRAALDGHPDQVDLDYHPNLNKPAASRYAATTPALLDWFKVHNADLAYSDQVGPFNFLLAYQVEPTAIHELPDYEDSIAETLLSNPNEIGWPKPIAQFSRDAGSAAENCFDRETGKPIPAGVLKTYKDVLGSYHLRPEQKFLNGNFQDKGITVRRHVKPIEIRQIGKESNRWQERPLLKSNKAAEIDYGVSNESQRELINLVREACEIVGQRELSKEIGISRQTLSKIMQGQLRPIPPELAALVTKVAVAIRSRANLGKAKMAALISAAGIEIQKIGLSVFASRLKINPSNLRKIAARKRPLNHKIQVALDVYFEGQVQGPPSGGSFRLT
jgi:DNA-binding XRE family transcriptional regulator